jgi:NAD(P)-dependent dehydrogenase (short-subunit alcohol dehydrogenase family)
MPKIDVSELLRPGLLHDVSIVLASTPSPVDAHKSLGAAVGAACTELGARVCHCQLVCNGSLALDETAVELEVDRVLADVGSPAMLVVDAASVFALAWTSARARGEADGVAHDGVARVALCSCLDASWNVTRAVANRAFLPAGHGGRIVYLAPPRDLGEHADAARAGLENLARTLSIEWARHRVTTVAITPGAGGGARTEVAALTAYLASPAGAYFSGCLLDLGGLSRGHGAPTGG